MILIIALGVFLGLCLFRIRGLLFLIFLGLLMVVAAHTEPHADYEACHGALVASYLGPGLPLPEGCLELVYPYKWQRVTTDQESVAVFPDIDIMAQCHEEAEGRTPTMLAEYPELSERYCIKFAKDAARLARARWAVLSADSRKECLHQAKVHNSDRNGRLVISAYMTLGHCLGK